MQEDFGLAFPPQDFVDEAPVLRGTAAGTATDSFVRLRLAGADHYVVEYPPGAAMGAWMMQDGTTQVAIRPGTAMRLVRDGATSLDLGVDDPVGAIMAGLDDPGISLLCAGYSRRIPCYKICTEEERTAFGDPDPLQG